jgi:hypothetical protein
MRSPNLSAATALEGAVLVGAAAGPGDAEAVAATLRATGLTEEGTLIALWAALAPNPRNGPAVGAVLGGWMRACGRIPADHRVWRIASVLFDLKAFPDGCGFPLRWPGALLLSDAPLERLPDGLVVDGDLFLGHCKALKTLPDDLRVTGRLDVRDCKALAKLPAGLSVRDLNVSGCMALTRLPKGLEVQGVLTLGGDPYGNFAPWEGKIPADVRIGRVESCGETMSYAEWNRK